MARSTKSACGNRSVRANALLGLVTVATKESCVFVRGSMFPLLIKCGSLEGSPIRFENVKSTDTSFPDYDAAVWFDLSASSEMAKTLEDCLKGVDEFKGVEPHKYPEGFLEKYQNSGERFEMLYSTEFGINNEEREPLAAAVPTAVEGHPAWKLIFSRGDTPNNEKKYTPFAEALEKGEITAIDVLKCMLCHDDVELKVGACDRGTEGKCGVMKRVVTEGDVSKGVSKDKCDEESMCIVTHLKTCEEKRYHDAFATGDDTAERHQWHLSRAYNNDFTQNVAALLRYARRDLTDEDALLLVNSYNEIQAAMIPEPRKDVEGRSDPDGWDPENPAAALAKAAEQVLKNHNVQAPTRKHRCSCTDCSADSCSDS